MPTLLVNLLHLRDNLLRITRPKRLRRAIDDQVEVFEDNRAHQGGVPIRLNDRVENAAAAAPGKVNSANQRTLPKPPICVTHADFSGRLHSQALGYRLRYDQAGRARGNDASDR